MAEPAPEPEAEPADWGELDLEQRYFAAYGSWWKIQREMLADGPRMRDYAAAIDHHADFLRGRTVLDVGAGTGVLSMLCAQRARPARVIAIEASEMAAVCRELVAAQGLEGVITVVQARVEDVAELEAAPHGVDAIISEWMGTGLVGEGMLDSVLCARDRWLTAGGLMLPSSARLFLCGWQHAATAELLRLGLGRAAAALAERLLAEWRGRPLIAALPEHCVCSSSQIVATLDLTKVTTAELDLIMAEESGRVLTVEPPGEADEVVWSGVALWWETGFGPSPERRGEVVLTTAPGRSPTHWGQLLCCDDAAPRLLRRGESVAVGRLLMQRDAEFRRNYHIQVGGTVYSLAEATQADGAPAG